MKNYQVHPTHWLISTQVLVFVGAGGWPGSGLADPAAAVHAAAGCGRGEAAAQEPRSCPFVLGGSVRRAGVRGAAGVFFLTLGTVSSTYRGISLALGLLGASSRASSSIAGLCRERVVATATPRFAAGEW